MLRTIKFRGKRIDTGEWVFGDLVSCSKKHAYIVTYFEKGEIIPEEALTACKCVIYKVKVETVGQFTGLLDRHGKEIYEGDVLQMFRHSDNTHRHEKDFVSKVSFEFGTFYVLGRYGTKQSFLHMARPGQSFEIIGNIHDNPELIHDQKAEVEHD